ncbi:hypothetical protein I6F35_02580 [Bradyrhizobium sp. BRP22]|uniref:hypothetical protein n=1 Tax=Bradyrhizobium sp. BRP22 TaxID=2793821 RepID=UPI001CD206F2|nr:hypothetical protein [Bradyrhizobium sp. BRP22]MCA1452099.1 hypothetical protein [Bradyrhizobium sp. BRP22]
MTRDHPPADPSQPITWKLNELARQADELFNGGMALDEREVGFLLLAFPIDKYAAACYATNLNRKAVVDLLREYLAAMEQ